MDENISNTPQNSEANNREAILRELVVRLATFPGDPRVNNPQLLVGQISDETKTDLRLELDATGQQCTQQAKMRRMHRPIMHELIPPLIPPAGTRQQGGGGGSGGDSVYSSATLSLDKDMDIVELASHSNTQLESGGWVRGDAGNSGPFAWSTWTFRDEDNEPWYGSFIIMRVPIQQLQYTLQVQANMDSGGNQQSGGWFSSSTPMTRL